MQEKITALALCAFVLSSDHLPTMERMNCDHLPTMERMRFGLLMRAGYKLKPIEPAKAFTLPHVLQAFHEGLYGLPKIPNIQTFSGTGDDGGPVIYVILRDPDVGTSFSIDRIPKTELSSLAMRITICINFPNLQPLLDEGKLFWIFIRGHDGVNTVRLLREFEAFRVYKLLLKPEVEVIVVLGEVDRERVMYCFWR